MQRHALLAGHLRLRQRADRSPRNPLRKPQWKAELLAQRPKTAKLVVNDGLRDYVQERLAGRVRDQHGAEVAGPGARAWTGRNVGRRKDRRWASSWSPEQIANRLPIDFPDDEFDTHLARGDPPGPLRASVRRTEA
jgi:hypothetical protein